VLLDERVQSNAAGQVELKLKTPRYDSTAHSMVTPLNSSGRSAALAHPRAGSRAPIRELPPTNGSVAEVNLVK
jgi:hypothetical protein